jgi:hypothetical protein
VTGTDLLFASVTGLATYYFGKYAFGSVSDYIALLGWGAGVGQTKNFIQQLGKTSGTARARAPGARASTP